jgi:hypothetical protein
LSIAIPGFLFSLFSVLKVDHEPASSNFVNIIFLWGLGFSAYLNKDIFNGRSIAKRILKIQVIDHKSNQAASPLKCLVRNLTIPIWPIEVIFVLVNPKRRLGDKIAGTRIDYIENPERVPVNWRKMRAPFLLAIGFSIMISLPFMILTNALAPAKIAFVQSSLNREESQKINRFIETESNGLIKKADFRVYDKVLNDDRKYVAGILYFDNQADFDNFKTSENLIIDLLRVKMPQRSSIWFLKFVYRKSGRSISVKQRMYDARSSGS